LFEKPDVSEGLKHAHTTVREDEINAQLDNLEAKARAAKWKVAGSSHSEWKKYWNLYYGRHWDGYTGSIPAAWRVTYNKVERNVKTQLALVSELDTYAEIGPAEQGDEITAYLLDAAVRYTWEKRHIPFKLKHVLLDLLVCGTGFAKVFWNYELDDNDVLPLHNESVFTAPDAPDFTRDRCPFVFIHTRMTVAEVMHRWPKAKGIKGQSGRDESDDIRDGEGAESAAATEIARNMAAAGSTQPTSTASYIPGRHFSNAGQDEKVTVQEWYLDDPDREKYPTGRMIIRVGKTIVEDKKNPYKHGQWPIVVFPQSIIPHKVWGGTSIASAAVLQRELNIMESLIVYNTHTQTTGRTYTIAGGIPAKKLERSMGKPGYVGTLANPAHKPLTDYPNPLPHGILQQRNNLVEAIDKVMGIQEVIPPGARGWPASGEVVEQMRESQQVEIREIADNFAEGVRCMVEQLAANTQQFYGEERFARIVGPLPERLEGLTDPTTGDPIVISESDNLHYVKFNPDNLKGGFDVSVTESTWQPPSRKARFDMWMTLQERFPDDVTFEDVAMDLDLKGKERILRRMRMKAEEPPPQEMPPEGMPPEGMQPGMPPPGMPPGPMGPPPGMPPM